jgi:1,2-diacylglycerol 3-beta-galactosyltransferase
MIKILILMSETGGGHRASAEAIRDAFHERYPHQFQVEMAHLWI